MELNSHARRILDLTREARTPSERDRRRVERALSASLGFVLASGAAATGVAATGGAVAGVSAKATAGVLAFKWAAGLSLVASAVTAGYLQFRPATAPARTDENPRNVTLSARPAAAAGAPSAPAQLVPAEPPQSAAVVTASAAELAPQRSRRGTAASRKPDTLAAELDLLHEAQAKWRNRNPAAALSLIALHRKRYPKSALAPEREALSVLSLCAAGRSAEAKSVAKRAFGSAPRSPLRATVEESCVKD
jgi:hypothetical protein